MYISAYILTCIHKMHMSSSLNLPCAGSQGIHTAHRRRENLLRAKTISGGGRLGHCCSVFLPRHPHLGGGGRVRSGGAGVGGAPLHVGVSPGKVRTFWRGLTPACRALCVVILHQLWENPWKASVARRLFWYCFGYSFVFGMFLFAVAVSAAALTTGCMLGHTSFVDIWPADMTWCCACRSLCVVSCTATPSPPTKMACFPGNAFTNGKP